MPPANDFVPFKSWEEEQEAREAAALKESSPPKQVALKATAREEVQPPYATEEPGEDTGLTATPFWPELSPKALYGLAGEVVRLIAPHTEADDAAILYQFHTAIGVSVGSCPNYQVESDYHHPNLYTAVVGNSAKGRKGTSWGRVRRLMEVADPTLAERTESGLSSGEGLIWAVRDPVGTNDHEAPKDKRLLVLESELASPLKVMSREGNTLSAVIRNAWDGGVLQSLTKNSPAKAQGAHIGIIGPITETELKRHLDATEFANGFANRFLFVCVRRSKVLPFGGNLDDEALSQLGREIGAALREARTFGRVTMDADARELWRVRYTDLSEAKPGMFGSLIARSEAQALRLSLSYALLDMSRVIRLEHLEAGLSCWDYCEASARYLFGVKLGDPVADTILTALKGAKNDGLTRTQIGDLFGRNRKAEKINSALVSLRSAHLARSEKLREKGRPAEVWYAR